MEGPHTYEMVDNPSYTVTSSRSQLDKEEYSTHKEAVEPNSTSVNKPDMAVAKTPSKVKKLTIATLIAVCVVVVLAAISIIVALVAYFNTNDQDSRFTDMQDQITKLTQDLSTTQSQLQILMSISMTPGKNPKPEM